MDEKKEKGVYQVVWDGNDGRGNAVATGIYLLRLESTDFVKVKKMVLIR